MSITNRFVKVKHHVPQRSKSDEEILGFDPLMPIEKMSPGQRIKATAYLMTRREEKVRAEQREKQLAKVLHKVRPN